MLTQILHKLRHWFLPHHSNNFRAKLLHNSGIFALLTLYLMFNILLRYLDRTDLHVLGFTSSITIDEVVRMTNQERLAQGLPALKYNELLADAARRKAANMFEENYWAHNSPSGKSPWVWFNAVGYKYINAGENLAKDFGNTDRMVAAWMASPTHRANILSDKFNEIGIAVVPGNLLGSDTVLVVQLFGSTSGGSVPAANPQVASVQATAKPETKGVKVTAPSAVPAQVQEAPVNEQAVREEPPTVMELKNFASPAPVSGNLPLYNLFDIKKLVSYVTTGLMILVLLADVVIAESNRLSRRVGKNWAHILFINVILILVTIVNAGSLLP